MAKLGLNKMMKALGPLIQERMAALESGQVLPGQPSGMMGQYSYLQNPDFLNNIHQSTLAHAEVPVLGDITVPSGLKTSDVRSLAESVSNINSPMNPQHESLLGKIWHNVEKPYQAVLGAINEDENWNDTEQSHGLWDRLKGEAGALAHGAKAGWQGKDEVGSFSDILEKHNPTLLPDAVAKNPVGKALIGLAGDIVLDPLTYTGVGALTKVKTLGATAEKIAKVQKVERTLEAAAKTPEEMGVARSVQNILLGNPERIGKWLPTKTALDSSGRRAMAMKSASEIAKKYSDIAYTDAVRSSYKTVAKDLEEQGFKKYDTLDDFRKAQHDSGLDYSEFYDWNKTVDQKIHDGVAKAVGGTKAEFKAAKEAELLEIAAKSNLAGSAADVGKQVQKSIALKFAGKPIAKLPINAELATRVGQASFVPKVARDLGESLHGAWNRVFRTGSHIDPLVNHMRLTRYSSLVEKMNEVSRNMRSIYGHLGKEERISLAKNVVEGRTNVVIKGGRDLIPGHDVENLVTHTTDEMHRIQNLVGEDAKSAMTFKEFNESLPSHMKVPNRFAKDPNWLQNYWKEHLLESEQSGLKRIGEDPATFLHLMQQAAFTTLANKELTKNVIERVGFRLTDAKGKMDPTVRLLKEKHGYRSVKYRPNKHAEYKVIKGYEGVVFEPDVAKAIEAMHEIQRLGAVAADVPNSVAWRYFSNATQVFKTIVTKYNPGFHERNLLGELFQAFADGVTDWRVYKKAAQVLRLHGMRELDTGVERVVVDWKGRKVPDARVHNAMNPDAFESAKINAVKGDKIIVNKRFRDFQGRKINGLTPDMVWHLFVDNGLKTGYLTTEMGARMGARSAIGKTGTAISNSVQGMTENIEDFARLGHFISRLERSSARTIEEAAEEAAQAVRKFHFDYSDFTNIERSVISKVVPFYKWTRKNIPLQFAMLLQKPGVLLSQMKGLDAISTAAGYGRDTSGIPLADQIMPQWLKDHLAVPVGMGASGTRYLDAPLPALDAMKFFGAGATDTRNNAMFMTNPFIKMPYELSTGHQIGGAPIQTDRYMAATTPYSNLIANLIREGNTGKSTNLLQFLVGAGFVENTPARVQSELKRQQAAKSKARKKYREQQGMIPLG